MTTPTELANKFVRKLKSTAESLRGDSGIFRRLKEEHAEIVALMTRISASTDPDVRAELFPKVRLALLCHAHAEQAEFYATLSEYEATRALALHGVVEHDGIEELVTMLSEMDMRGAAWPGTFDSMMRMVEQHVSEEEHELFREARKVLTVRELEAMELRFDARRRLEEERLTS